jgi:small GTP-binding protein
MFWVTKESRKVSQMALPSSPFPFFLADGIDRLNDLIEGERFNFVINGTECFTTLIESVLISPQVFCLIQSDPTTRLFEISDERIEAQFFSDLIRLIRGEIVRITSGSRKSLILFCRQFGNSSLEKYIFSLKIQNSESEIVVNSNEMEALILGDFSSFSIQDLSLLDIEILEEMLSDPELRIPSEDWLVHTIIELGSSFSGLFQFVRFEFLSQRGMSELVDNFEYPSLTEKIWIGIARLLRGEFDKSVQRQRFGVKERRYLMLGLDESGKTTILYQLKLGKCIVTIPTLGFNVETIEAEGYNSNLWDIGGQKRIRALWTSSFHDTDGLIFVVDSNDIGRLDEARDEFQKLLQEDELKNAVLLVYANKQDLPYAIKSQELENRLGLNSITDRPWKVQEASATTGEGLREGFNWLNEEVKKRF